LARLGTIRSIIRDFREARGPLWDLRNTVRELKELEPAMQGLGDQVDAVRKQVAELQVLSISTRTGKLEDERVAGAPAEVQTDEANDKNWETLRDYWKRNNSRIEYVIDQIADGRTKLAYDRLPRTHYTRIINKLQGQKIISAAAANASRSLHDLFNSYRPRNRDVPDEVVQSLAVLDAQLDKELLPYSVVQAAEVAEDDSQVPPTRTPPANGRATDTIPAQLRVALLAESAALQVRTGSLTVSRRCLLGPQESLRARPRHCDLR
jgi:hypothetical protein